MEFLTKFFKSLNSAESSKFMVLAISLGIVSGFLPTFNVLNILIMFIVFVFRIPMGLFFASSTFFYFIGYLSDYLFHKIGLVVLKADFLHSFWQTLYNTPFMRWTNFNNTITMGSFISGIILSIIAYFILNKSINKYREVLFPKLAKISLLKWIVPDEVAKKGIFRLSGLIGFVVVFGGFTWLIITFTNPLLKNVLLAGLTKATHKLVSIQSVDFSFKNLSLDIKNLQIDKTQVKNFYLKLNWDKFVWKKYDIASLKANINLSQPIYETISKKEKSNTPTQPQTEKTSSYNFKLPKNLLDTNLKDKVQNYTKEVKDFYNKYKKYLPKKEEKVEYVRGKGIDIRFKDTNNYPEFALNNGTIVITNSKTSDKATINFSYFNKLKFDGKISKLKLNNFQAKNLTISALANISFKGYYKDDIYATIFTHLSDTKLKYNTTNKIVNKILNSIHKFDVTTYIKGQKNIKITSNIDKLLADKSKNILKDELKKKLNSKVKSKLKSKLKSLFKY